MDIIFTPVKVSRGRKFRGFAYSLGLPELQGSFGTLSCRLYDPKAQKYVYANADFCEAISPDPNPEQTAADKATYLNWVVANTLAWCKSIHPDASESSNKQFARNCLMKQHPELKDWIDTVLPDSRDAVAEIEHTLQWAMTLKTQACYMYGRWCQGGNPLPDERKVKSAYKALCFKGITHLDGFAEAWQFCLDAMCLPNPIEKIS